MLMASILSVIPFVLCLSMTKAFPKVRRGYDYGYVLYSLPQRCVPAPSDPVCNVNHNILYYKRKEYGSIARSINATYDQFKSTFPKFPRCAKAIKELMCQVNFPRCLSGGRLDYGSKNKTFNAVRFWCGLVSYFDPNILLNQYAFKGMKSGVVRNPYATTCNYVAQDPLKLCPKPRYKMPSTYANIYRAQVANVFWGIREHEDKIPGECYQLMKNVFACSYLFCSPKEEYGLMKTTKQKCFSILHCFKTYEIHDESFERILNETCPKYPDENTAKKVFIHV